MTFLNVLAKITGIYNLLLIIIAVFLNPLVLYVCVKSEKLRSHSTFKLLAFNSINDILVCLAWNFECFTNTFFDFLPFFRSIFYCKWISVFVSFTTQCFTSWMLLSISIDRLLSITIKNWHKRYFTGSRPIVYSFLLAFIIAGINLNEIFIGGYVEIINGTEYIDCFSNPPGSYPWYHLMAQVMSSFKLRYIQLKSLMLFFEYRFCSILVSSDRSGC